ncbi:MAG TPA: ABC-2 family transporter protein, partial [Candidatus Methylacidiphilales bacterium]|nr:ABC-2 family transporter protein [Candidatus Methylacidiphilales bacterium]
MTRYATLWLAQIRYSLARELMFKANFILWIIVELSWFALQLAFVEVLYFKVDNVAGWSKWEMVLLVSTAQLVQQIFTAFLLVNLYQLPEHIRTGKLDFYLAQPVSTQFLVSTRQFDLGGVVNSVIATCLCIYAAMQVPVVFSFSVVAVYIVMVLTGVIVHYSIMLMMMTMAFWITKAQGLVNAYYNAFQIARIPREAVTGIFGFIFTWMLPMLFVANVPASVWIRGDLWPLP